MFFADDWGEAPNNYVAAGKTASLAMAIAAIIAFILLFLIIMCLEFSEDRYVQHIKANERTPLCMSI